MTLVQHLGHWISSFHRRWAWFPGATPDVVKRALYPGLAYYHLHPCATCMRGGQIYAKLCEGLMQFPVAHRSRSVDLVSLELVRLRQSVHGFI